jgi:hypothetical protein
MTPTDVERIEAFLATIKAEWRSSPDGLHWHRFFQLLEKHANERDDRPPPPFILSGSGSSNATKLERLGEQLRWAAARGCLDNALEYLGALPVQHWNAGNPDRWHMHSIF